MPVDQDLGRGLTFLHDSANHEAVVTAAETLLSLPKDVATDVVDRNSDFLAKSTQIDKPGMDKAFKLLADNGLAKKAYTTGDYAADVC